MRKERVFIDENAHIQNLCCEVNLDGGISKATISFDNLGYGVITAIKFCAQGFNAFNDIVLIEGKGSFFLIVQDIASFACMKNVHDDAADSLAMLADYLSNGIKTVSVGRRPF